MFDGLIIAEIGSVHDGSFGNAMNLVEVAAKAGANAIKFQTHIAEYETTNYAPNPSYFSSEDRFDYFNRTSFNKEQWKKLKKHCEDLDVTFLSSAFSIEALQLLEEIDVKMHKVPSGEVTNLPLIEALANLGKPVLLSSGMSTWDELDAACNILKDRTNFCVMQCSSLYPCPPEKIGLNIIPEMFHRYGCPVGFSDHSLGSTAAIGAALAGAVCIEKHITFSKLMYGSDAKNSMEPEEFSSFANSVREAWVMASSSVDKNDVSIYQDMKKTFQKSIVASKNLKAGVKIDADSLAFKKPGTGMQPNQAQSLIGKTLKEDVAADQQFKDEHF